MTDNFRNFRSVEILHSTSWNSKGKDTKSKVFKEQLKTKSPDLFLLKTMDGDRERIPEMAYLQLLISNKSERIESLLSWMGIDLQMVSFTRLNGSIAYRIGDKAPESPKILIEKERFIPLELVYRSRVSESNDTIHVRFDEYRKLDQGWYPFRITYGTGLIEEVYSVEGIQVNIHMDSGLMQSQGLDLDKYERPEIMPPTDESEMERLKRIIRAFEEKYE